MSETTNTPEPEDLQGTFVGGSFGEASAEPVEKLEGELEGVHAFGAADGADDAGGVESVGGTEDVPDVEEDVERAGGGGTDVEGVGDGVAPGERNEPV